ncbi:FkbM family methyltransferase, partial [Nitrospiraceae bacterium AH_259_D15_M11_P09]|nr:FkbM family methyltransferase [Nitrospiraceae bacterium AH_259_D15_M11_P09]
QSAVAGVIRVESIRLDDYVRNGEFKPDVIKIDVEGAEVSVLTGAKYVLEAYKPVCLVSTHGANLLDDCREYLNSIGYKVHPLRGFEHELCCFPKLG